MGPSSRPTSPAEKARYRPAAGSRRSLLHLGPLQYLARLRTAQQVLWCYLIWYLVVLARYFDASLTLWLSSAGISVIVGTALYLSTAHAGHTRMTLGRWQVARLFAMPFCVSSFAALIKGHGFVLVFHPRARDNLVAAAACVAFIGTALVLRRVGGSGTPTLPARSARQSRSAG
jgi:hypothetical protein